MTGTIELCRGEDGEGVFDRQPAQLLRDRLVVGIRVHRVAHLDPCGRTDGQIVDEQNVWRKVLFPLEFL